MPPHRRVDSHVAALPITRALSSYFLAPVEAVRTKSIGGVPNFNYYPLVITGNEAAIYLPDQSLGYAKTYSIQVDAGAFKSRDGHPLAGLSEPQSWRFSTRAAPPAADTRRLVVAADGSGDFATVQGAIDAVPAGNTTPITIFIRSGVYYEIICFVGKNHVTFLNGTTDARAILANVDLRSFQDTLQINGQAYISNCYIEGDVDFLWGTGPCFFENCEAKSLRSRAYYTQIRNPPTNHGYVFKHCTFNGEPGVSDNVLSRIEPARFPASEVVLIDCVLSSAVGDVAWRLDRGTEAPSVHFWEYNSRNSTGNPIDVSQRLGISRQLALPADQEAIASYSDPRFVLGGQWTPRLAPIITSQPASISVGVGQQTTVSVDAAAVPIPAFQWRKNGTNIAGATGALITIDSVTPADAGQYTVVINNVAGETTSGAATTR